MGTEKPHFVEVLEIGDKLKVNIRHAVDGSKNKMDVAATLVYVHMPRKVVFVQTKHGQYEVPYNDCIPHP